MTIRQNIRSNTLLREMLAAEYVLGTLRGGARRRLETWLPEDALLNQTVNEWQGRLNPMSEFAPAVAPSPDVWRAISRKIGLEKSAIESRKSFWRNLREDIGFWRGLGMASTALATILVAVLITQPPAATPPVTSFVAMLHNDQSQPMAVIMGDAHHHTMTIKMVGQHTVAAEHSLELWAVPKEGNPRSLGLMKSDGSSMTIAMPAGTTPDTVPLLAVTLEPKGGSPNPNGPSGPIVFKGAWVQLTS